MKCRRGTDRPKDRRQYLERTKHMTSWPLGPTELQDAELGLQSYDDEQTNTLTDRPDLLDSSTYLTPLGTWPSVDRTHTQRGTVWDVWHRPTGRRTDRHTENKEDRTLCYSQASQKCARLFHKWWTVLLYWKVQFCRRIGAEHRA